VFLKGIASFNVAVLALVLSAFPAALAWSQEPTPQTQGSPRVPLKMSLVAHDKNGDPVTDLKAGEVRVFENRVEQKVDSLAKSDGDPLTVVFLFDTSGSRHEDGLVAEELRHARELLHSVWKEGDIGSVLTFGNSPSVIVRPSNDLKEVDQGILSAAGSRFQGKTALYDALGLLDPRVLAKTPGRKAFIVLSDFEDNASKNSLEMTLHSLQLGDVQVFAIVVGEWPATSKKIRKEARDIAEKLAEDTGGEEFVPLGKGNLSKAFEGIKNDIQNYYWISYLPPSETPHREQRKIKIVTTRRGATLLYARVPVQP
jgi:VWFA-related protein